MLGATAMLVVTFFFRTWVVCVISHRLHISPYSTPLTSPCRRSRSGNITLRETKTKPSCIWIVKPFKSKCKWSKAAKLLWIALCFSPMWHPSIELQNQRGLKVPYAALSKEAFIKEVLMNKHRKSYFDWNGMCVHFLHLRLWLLLRRWTEQHIYFLIEGTMSLVH